jgi:hypothetical protein
MPKLEFSKESDISYGFWKCPNCRAQFYGGGPAVHDKSCSKTGYAGCIYVIGPKVIEAIKAWARTYGDDAKDTLNGISLNDIREQLPNHAD